MKSRLIGEFCGSFAASFLKLPEGELMHEFCWMKKDRLLG